MNVILKVRSDGSEESENELKQFVSDAKTQNVLTFFVETNNKTNEQEFKWILEPPQDFSLQAFFPIPMNVQGDIHLSMNVTRRLTQAAKKAWKFEGELTCETLEMFKTKYNAISQEKVMKRYTKAKTDFWSVSTVEKKRNRVTYDMCIHTPEFVDSFEALSKKYMSLRFNMFYKIPEWQPGDEQEKEKHCTLEWELGMLSYLNKETVVCKRGRRGWAPGSERRNIWNVIDEHIDENGCLNQPDNELPNGRRMDALENNNSNRPRFRPTQTTPQLRRTLRHYMTFINEPPTNTVHT